MANLLASSSNSSGNKAPYAVFINHRGPDTKLSIAGHLYNRLHDVHGLQVFLDKEEMEKGDFFTSQIAAAIREASVHIAIFSPGYADSEWCLNELLLMWKSMESGRSTIIPLFYGVNPEELRWTVGKDGIYAKALTKLEEKKTTDSQTRQEKPRYNSDVIAKWRKALSDVSLINGLDLERAYDRAEWKLVNDVVQLVLEKVKKPPLDVSKYPIGLDKKVKDFEELLQQQGIETRVIGIVGLGGVGKTTLAKEIFNRLRSEYKQSSFLFDIRVNSLPTLQSHLLEDLIQSNKQIHTADEGKGFLRRSLLYKEALIILDDVDHDEQLEALLLPAKEVLHSSSLILVTSRDKQLLINNDINESAIYKLECLNQQDSQELFCLHALGKPRPEAEFERFVREFSQACCGLPLSLTVIGRLLHGINDLRYWTAKLREINNMLPDDLQGRLKISYDSLKENEKLIFLDIACFFIGEDRDTAIRVWNGSNLDGWLGLLNLQNKCLIEVDSKNNIRMHDHLRDLGRTIGEKNSPYRLWRLTDKILEDLPDKFTVRGINMVETSAGNRAELGNRLLGMRGLKLVRAEGDCLQESIFRSVQSHLIWLRWDRCPHSCLPPWIPMERLRVLQVCWATTLRTLWGDHNHQVPLYLRELHLIGTHLLEIPKSIAKLKYLEKFVLESHCFSVDLETLPDEFCRLQSLEHLRLFWCSMKSLPDSFGNLTKLQHIDLLHIQQLQMLPDSFGKLRNLRRINFSGCTSLKGLPDSLGNLRKLQELNFSQTSIKGLPDAFGELKILQHIKLYACRNLEKLPDTLGDLKNLQHIDLGFCGKLEKLPDSFGKLKSLQYICLSYCEKLKRLPDSFGELQKLRHLDLHDCLELQIFPDTFGKISTLECLDLSVCPKIKVWPPQVAHNLSLLKLFLSGTNLKELPSAIGELSNLQVLHLGSELKRLPDNIGDLRSLQKLELSGCIQLKCLPDSIRLLTQLKELKIKKSSELKGLPNDIGDLRSLQKLKLSGCSQLKCLPDSFGLLTQLRELRMKELGVGYLPPCVMKLNTLQELKIQYCPLSKLPFRKIEEVLVFNKLKASVVKCMLPLKYLTLCGIKISELSVSEGVCPNLQHLNIYRCGCLEEVGALPTTLIEIQLGECCALRKIGGLFGLEKLEKFQLVKCDKVEELPGLETLISLEELRVNCHYLKSIDGLAQLTRLQMLDMGKCRLLEELSGLEHLTWLRVLRVSGCAKLHSIEGLAQLTELKVLNVADCCELKEISGLQELKLLWNLNVSGCRKLQSIEGLAQLTELKVLNVADCCELKEISGLHELKLWNLTASGCGKLQSIEGLAQLTGLHALNVASCYELKEMPGLDSSYCEILMRLATGNCVA